MIRQRRPAVPEDRLDRSLEALLAYETRSADSAQFVNGVMKEVRGELRKRRLILALFGIIGALFGIIGAFMLTESIHWVFTRLLSATVSMQLVLVAAAAASFYVWMMYDDLALDH